MQNLHLFSGSANPELARRMAAVLDMPLGHVEIQRFAEGEVWVKYVQNIRGGDVFIVQPTCSPPNETLMELLIMLDAAHRASAQRVTAVLPFYGYGRQDRKDQPRVPITAKLVANLLVTAGANRILAMDFHAQQIQGFFDVPVDHLYAAPAIVRYLHGALGGEAVVVAPDSGSVKMAHTYADMLGSGFAVVAKRRISADRVASSHLVGEVQGRDCVLVDDLTTTGSTLIEAAAILLKAGASRVRAAVSHYCVTADGHRRLLESPLHEIITTDSIPLPAEWPRGKLRVLSVADLLAEAVRRIHMDQSVSSLFRLHPDTADGLHA
jgi:ribose-phosphate pyrophosphokinase